MGALALIAAACGSSGSKPAASGLAVQSQPQAQAAPARSAPIAIETANARYGKILTTAQGFAVYTYTADEPGGPGCSSLCLQYWPPLLVPAGTTHPLGGPGVTGLGTFPRGSRLQVTFRGLPLYTYISDKQPGQVTGQNVVDSGGTWHLVILNAVKSPAAPGPAPTKPSPPVTTPSTQAPPAPPSQLAGKRQTGRYGGARHRSHDEQAPRLYPTGHLTGHLADGHLAAGHRPEDHSADHRPCRTAELLSYRATGLTGNPLRAVQS